MGGIHNCPIRAADVDIAENIFGPDMATLKGKSVRKKPKPVVEDWLELPKEIHIKHMRVELCMDIININKIAFMTAIDRLFRYRSIILIKNKHGKKSKKNKAPQDYLDALNTIVT